MKSHALAILLAVSFFACSIVVATTQSPQQQQPTAETPTKRQQTKPAEKEAANEKPNVDDKPGTRLTTKQSRPRQKVSRW